MTDADADAKPEDLHQILALATALAQQVLRSDAAEDSAHPERRKILLSAAQFLHDNDVAWPHVLREAVAEAAQRRDAAHGR